MEKRNVNIMFMKNGHGSLTNRISLPVPWIKAMGFNEENRTAIIEFDGKEIRIKKSDA